MADVLVAAAGAVIPPPIIGLLRSAAENHRMELQVWNLVRTSRIVMTKSDMLATNL